jgi:hypothetical protein
VGKTIASNIATFAAAQTQVKGWGRWQVHKAAFFSMRIGVCVAGRRSPVAHTAGRFDVAPRRV